MAIKLKVNGNWVDQGDAAALRAAANAQPPTVPPAVDVSTLPDPAALDPDVPLQQLFFECPQTRHYITKDGKMRSGLTGEQKATAEAILQRYGGTR